MKPSAAQPPSVTPPSIISTPVIPTPATPDAIAEAARILQRGGLVAFPTETVYGLGANALDADAVARIFAAKGRPAYNPLIVHVAEIDAARQLVTEWPEQAQRLAERFWPGPLTLILPKAATIPDIVTAGLPSVAVRVPAHPVARELLITTKLPLAAPSANRFTQLSPTTAQHVAAALGDRVEMILEGGPCDVGIESSVLDLTSETPVLLRPGGLSREELETVVGPIGLAGEVQSEKPRLSPGMVERHYAPRAPAELVENVTDSKIRGKRTGALLYRTAAAQATQAGVAEIIEMPSEAASYARQLYMALHALDATGCDLILIETVPQESAWEGVRDRLRRATYIPPE